MTNFLLNPDTAENAVLLLGGGGLSGVLAWLLNRKYRTAAADKLSAETAAVRTRLDLNTFRTIISGFEVRLTEMEGSLTRVKDDLADERAQHERTRLVLRISLRHIRAIVVWASGPKDEQMPELPDELIGQI